MSKNGGGSIFIFIVEQVEDIDSWPIAILIAGLAFIALGVPVIFALFIIGSAIQIMANLHAVGVLWAVVGGAAAVQLLLIFWTNSERAARWTSTLLAAGALGFFTETEWSNVSGANIVLAIVFAVGICYIFSWLVEMFTGTIARALGRGNGSGLMNLMGSLTGLTGLTALMALFSLISSTGYEKFVGWIEPMLLRVAVDVSFLRGIGNTNILMLILGAALCGLCIWGMMNIYHNLSWADKGKQEMIQGAEKLKT